MTMYPFQEAIAFDPYTRTVAAGAGQVYALADVNHLSPLSPTDENGFPVLLETDAATGYLPTFYVEDHPEVVFKSGDWTKILVTTRALEGVPGERGLDGTNGVDGVDGVDGERGLPGLDAMPQAEGMAEHISTPGPVQTALNAQTAQVASDALATQHALDIWPEYRTDGSGDDSWDGTTYAGWIGGIDTALGSAASKQPIGTDAGGRTIWAYTAGADNVPHAVLVGGTHAIESTSMHAPMRYFQMFATSEHPAMVSLRSRLRLTLIPTLTPSGYRSNRNNGDGTNVNRNFDYYWQYSTDPDKGAASMDSPGAQAMKSLLDSTKIACVIDCHMWDNTGPTLQWAGASQWTTTKQDVAAGASALWAQTYGGETGTIAHMGSTSIGGAMPQVMNWAEKYMRFRLNRDNAFAAIVEAKLDLGGSTSLWTTTRQGMRWYCGFLHLLLVQWLDQGQSAVNQPSITNVARRINQATSATIAEGGTRIASTTSAPLAWDAISGRVDTVPFLDVSCPAPGEFVIEATLALHGYSLAKQHRLAASLHFGPTPAGGGTVSQHANTEHRVDLSPSTFNPSTVLQLRWRFPVANVSDVDLFHRVQLAIRDLDANPDAATATSDYVGILRGSLSVTHTPDRIVAQAPPVFTA